MKKRRISTEISRKGKQYRLEVKLSEKLMQTINELSLIDRIKFCYAVIMKRV